MPAQKPTPDKLNTPPSLKRPSSEFMDRYMKKKLFPDGTPDKANGTPKEKVRPCYA